VRVLVLYNQPKTNRPDDLDTLNQAKEIEKTLYQLGYPSKVQGIEDDLGIIKESIIQFKPDRIFNCVEEFRGSVSHSFYIPKYLESLNMAFTGSSSKAMRLSASKLNSKQLLKKASLATPDFITLASNPTDTCSVTYIVKSSDEHASLGIDARSIVTGISHAKKLIKEKKKKYSGEWFAEEFIDGREFNVALIGSRLEPEVLPMNEILFDDFPEDLPKIVDYDAKWNPNSFGYHHTPRKTLSHSDDASLQNQLHTMALLCWNIFELNGYARIDFRVDKQDNPWILEINSNPCLSEDAGFMASAIASGLSIESTIEKILDNCEVKKK
jgi:D-alanine-D-alanine ligase